MHRSIALALLLAVLAACHATPSASPLVIDCRAGASEERSDLADFLHACQRASGRNFTWTSATDERLNDTAFEGPARVEVPASELDAWLATTLARHGFTLSPVGPKRLNVWLVAASSESAARTSPR